MGLKYLIILIGLLSILWFTGVCSAEIVCETNYITQNMNKSDIVTKTIHCTNTANQTVNISKIGQFNLNANSFNPNQGKDILITFDTSNSGLFSGQITFSDSSSAINLFFYINEITQQGGCNIDLFPLSLSNVKIQQGEKKTRYVQISVPNCYNKNIKINGVTLQTDEKPIKLGELLLGNIQPGNSVQIPIEMDAIGVATGTYSDILSLLVYDLDGNRINLPSVSISVMVTSGITPISNFTFSQLPTCSIDSIVLNLNNSYKLTCNLNNPNFNIKPTFDTSMIKGISATKTSNQYIYEFQGIKVGKTNFCAEFVYDYSSIGSPFCQEIKINPTTSNSQANTNLDLEFFQNDKKVESSKLSLGKTRFLVVDFNNRNIVSNYEVYINGEKTNSSEFEIKLDKVYDLRIDSNGYNTLIKNISATLVPIDFTIYPSKDLYTQNELIYFNSSIENVTYLVDNIKVNNPYTLYSASEHNVMAVKEGYLSTNKSIKVEALPILSSCSPMQSDWKFGDKISCQLSKTSSWVVFINSTKVAEGNGIQIDFEIKKEGVLDIIASNNKVYSNNFEEKGFFSFLKKHWIISISALIFLLFVIFIIFRNKNNPSNVTTSYS